jgi:hypothetical protein
MALNVDFTLSFANTPICLGETLNVLVTVTKKGRDSLDGAYVHFRGDSYFQDSSEYIKNSKATLYLKPWANPTIEKLQSTLNFDLYDKNNQLLRHVSFSNSLGMFYFIAKNSP